MLFPSRASDLPSALALVHEVDTNKKRYAFGKKFASSSNDNYQHNNFGRKNHIIPILQLSFHCCGILFLHGLLSFLIGFRGFKKIDMPPIQAAFNTDLGIKYAFYHMYSVSLIFYIRSASYKITTQLQFWALKNIILSRPVCYHTQNVNYTE